MPLYLYILIGSLSIPLLYSIFVMDFIKHWKHFLISTSVIAVLFLIWDAIFTHLGIWSFNPDYCLGINILKMPIEEWLFFFVIPFCSLFTHYALVYLLPDTQLSKKTTLWITYIFLAIIIVVLATNLSKAYTTINYTTLAITLILNVLYRVDLLQRFLLSFIVILIPFFIVNGILTGAATAEPVVSYNDLENLGIRIGTIPVEDIGYAFTMLMGNLSIFEYLNKKNNLSRSL